MPGHKRSDKFGIVGSEIDITEIDGADNLHEPHGNILEIENALAEIYKSKKSFLMTNGSTGGISAASDVYKRQILYKHITGRCERCFG